jgi:hypothetical protein
MRWQEERRRARSSSIMFIKSGRLSRGDFINFICIYCSGIKIFANNIHFFSFKSSSS